MFRSDTGAPLPGVRVSTAASVTVSDDQGWFELGRLAAGQYRLTASKSGFVTRGYGQAITLPPGQAVERLEMVLPKGAVVAGMLRSSGGAPLVSAPVWLLRQRFVNGERRLVSMAVAEASTGAMNAADTTDDRGEFRLYGLMPGAYYLAAALPDRSERSSRESTRPAAGVTPTLFPGTVQLSEAQPIVVAAGQELGGLELTIARSRNASIRGSVTTTAPAGRVASLKLIHHGITGDSSTFPRLQPDGSFSAPNLGPGDYTLTATDGDYATVAKVKLNGDDVLVPLTLRKGFEIRGRLLIDGKPPALKTLETFTVGSRSLDSGISRAATMSGTEFHLTGVMGPQRLFVAISSPVWALRSIRYGGADMTDASMNVDADMRGVEITLTQQFTVLAGTVEVIKGSVAPDVTVVVFAEDEEKWGPQTRHVKTARPDQNGQFVITGLPATRYLAVAVESLEEGEEGNLALLRQLRRVGTRLSLAVGEKKTIHLQRTRLP